MLKTELLNTLPNNKFLDWSKLKAFEDAKINVTEKIKFVLERIKTWINEKMLVNSIFSFFHNVFKRLLFPKPFPTQALVFMYLQ